MCDLDNYGDEISDILYVARQLKETDEPYLYLQSVIEDINCQDKLPDLLKILCGLLLAEIKRCNQPIDDCIQIVKDVNSLDFIGLRVQ